MKKAIDIHTNTLNFMELERVLRCVLTATSLEARGKSALAWESDLLPDYIIRFHSKE